MQDMVFQMNGASSDEGITEAKINLNIALKLKTLLEEAGALTDSEGAKIVADKLNIPMGYVRGSSKDHGRKNQIEGRLEKGQKVVVIEDLISTGGSVIDVVNVLREAGAEVLGVASIFTYGMKKGLDRLAEANVKNISLTNFDGIAQIAADEKALKTNKDSNLFTMVIIENNRINRTKLIKIALCSF